MCTLSGPNRRFETPMVVVESRERRPSASQVNLKVNFRSDTMSRAWSRQLQVNTRVRFQVQRWSRVCRAMSPTQVANRRSRAGSCTRQRLHVPAEFDGPAGGSGGPCPASQGVGDPERSRGAHPIRPAQGRRPEAQRRKEEAMRGGSQYVVSRAQHCWRYTHAVSLVRFRRGDRSTNAFRSV